MKRDTCIDLLRYKNDVWVVSCHWYVAVSGELLSQVWIWGNKEVAQWHCHWPLASMLGFSRWHYLLLTQDFPLHPNVLSARAGFDIKLRMKRGLYRQLLLLVVSFQQLAAKRYQFYFLIILVALWGFCFNIENFSYWAQLSSHWSQQPDSSCSSESRDWRHHRKCLFVLFWSFCFPSKKNLNRQINSQLL